MAFWIFMLTTTLLVPFVMIGLGKVFMQKPPKEISSIYGYRTSMSMKNKDTWEFAHRYCGRIWYRIGWVLLPCSVLPMFLVWGESDDMVGTWGGVICIVQTIPLVAAIILTEKALRKTFDRDGKRRQ